MKDRLVQLLNSKNMRPAQLAQLAGISTSTVDDIVKGRANELNIGVDKMLKIADVLDVSVEYLYGRAEPTGFSQPHDRDEALLLELWREATDEARECTLMVLKCNKRLAQISVKRAARDGGQPGADTITEDEADEIRSRADADPDL